VSSKELIIDVRSSEVSIALLEDKQLAELQDEESNLQFAVGDIYLGKVKKIMPGLNAAFIDVGYEKDAFLHYQDMGPQYRSLNKYLKLCMETKGKTPIIQKFHNEPDIDKNGKIIDVLTFGQIIIVQVVKEPISTKGPRLSSEISIAGRNLVLIPFSDKISISQKIQSNEERDRLRTLLQSIKPKNYGVIVRTVAESKKVAVLDSELRGLVRKWETMFDNIKNGRVPRIVLSEINRTSAILRDILNASFSSICVNDDSVYQEIVEYINTIAPEKEKIVKLYEGSVPIFEHFGIEKQIKSLFGKTVSIKNGAYLIIEHTEALHAIDVNSGNRSKSAKDQETNACDANMAAVSEIARQLRLRDMGGIIVVDFIDMHMNDHKFMVFEKMKDSMEQDRAKHSILPLSKFGLMQITRQRVRPEMTINTLEKCPACKGSGEITPSILLIEEIENKLSSVIQNTKTDIYLRVHPFIAAYLCKDIFSIRYKWQLKFKRKIRVKSVSALNFLDYRFVDKDNKEIKIN